MTGMKKPNIIICLLVVFSSGNCQWLPMDTTTSLGQFVKYVRKSDSTYVINWGNSKISRCTEPISFGALNWTPVLRTQNNNYIFLHYGCGLDCWNAMALPMNLSEPVQEIPYPILYETGNNIVVHLCEIITDTLLVVKNMLLNDSLSLIRKKCSSEIKYHCIDTVWISGTYLYVKPSNLYCNLYGNEKNAEKPIKIKISALLRRR
jgi:hypothetical protein